MDENASHVENDTSLPSVEPEPSGPKTIGLLNIIFGSILLLCGSCSGMYLAFAAISAPMIDAQFQQMQQMVAAQRAAQIAELQRQETAAKTTKEKAAIRAQRKAIESQPAFKPPDFRKLGPLGDLRILVFSITDTISSIILNTAMLISGIGLLSLKPWARVAGIWVAIGKIARLLALYGFCIVVLVPVYVRQIMDMFTEIAAGGGGPPPGQLQEMASMFGILMTGGCLSMIILGAIYPAIALFVLMRPGAKAACSGMVVSAFEG
jgi:hypothetical protein